MGRALALSDRASLRAVGASASAVSVADASKVNADPSRISAEIVKLGVTPLPKLRASIRKQVADPFWRTFDGESVNAKCDDAAWKVRGVSAATFARIAAQETDKIDHALVQVMQALHQQKYGFAFHELAIRARGSK